MAHAFYGLDAGQKIQDVVVASATNSTDVEVNVDLTNVTSKQQLLLALDNIKSAIVNDNFPPV